MRRISGIIALVLGVLLIAGAGVVRWVVAPAVTVLPGDTNTTRVYTGTATSVLNPTVLTGTLFGPAMLHNLPATVTHNVKVLATKGNNALVADHKIVTVAGRTVADFTDRYAVNRKTMGHGTGFSDVINQTGVTFNWPLNAKKQDIVGWASDVMQPAPIHYIGTEKVNGITTYVFKDTVATARITDPNELAQLPKALPKAMVNQMAPTLGLTTAQLQQMAKLLPLLPDPIPLVYTFNVTSQYWIAPASGIIVNATKHEVRISNVLVGGQLVPIGPVLDLTYTGPPATIAAAVADAKDKASQMTLIHTTMPAVLLGAGILLLIVGVVLLAVRRRVPPEEAEELPIRELTSVG